ncbi:MAG: tetratricopeptide repeat protein [Candidatus Brocadiia bacterium]
MRRTTRLILLALLLVAASRAGLAADASLLFDYAEGLYRDGLRKQAAGKLQEFLDQFPDDPRAPRARFYLAECRYAAGDYKAALAAYEAAAGDLKLPQRRVALYRMGECRYRLGDSKGAVGPLREFLAEPPASPDQRRFVVHAKYTLARAYLDLEQHKEALDAFQQVLVDTSAQNPYKPYVLLPIADCLAALGQPEEALARYRALEEKLVQTVEKAEGEAKKRHADMLVRLRAKMANVLLNQKDYEQALSAFGQLSDAGPFAQEALYGRAQCLFFLKRYQEALVPAQRYIQRFPEGKLRLSVLFIAAESCYRTEHFAQAEGHYGRLVAEDKDRSFPAHQTAAYGRTAAAYRQGKDHARAIVAAADYFLEHFPDSERAADARYFRAEAHFWLEDYAQAIRDYQAVPAGNDHAAESAHQTAVCLDLLDRHRDAAAAYDAYLAKWPDGEHHKNALERAARLWGQLGEYAKAAQRYGAFAERYAEAEPELAEEFLYRKGACQYEAGQYDAMYRTFQAYFERHRRGPHRGDVLYFLAWYHSEQKQQYERAASFYELCAQLPGDYQLPARYLLAHTYARLGKARRAEKKEKEADAYFVKAAETFLHLIREAPQHLSGPEEYRWTGDVFLEARRYKEAAEAYEALLGLYAPADKPLEERLGAFLAKDGDPAIIYWLGKLHLEAEPPDYEQAAAYFAYFDGHLKDHEYFIWAKFGLAEALRGGGKHDQAWSHYQRVESLAPHVFKDDFEVRDDLILRCQFQLGRMAYDDKNYEHARKYLLRVGYLAAGEVAAEALYKAAHAARQLGDGEAAVAIWQRLRRVHPDSPWTKKLLGKLDDLGLQLAADGQTLEKKPAAP